MQSASPPIHMSTTDAVRSTVYFEPDLHEALRLKSAQSRRSMSEIVNQALRLALREDEEDLASVRKRAREKPLDYEAFLAKLKADGTL
jgi:Arc/MetJ-type ribon-helix-helix transcriptional regulator